MAATTEATVLGPQDEISLVAASALNAGQIVSYGGRAGYVKGLQDVAVGDRYTLKFSGRIRVPALSTLTGSAGANVDWDDAANQIVADAAGTFALGKLAVAKTNGQTTAEVFLNEQGPTT